MSEQIPETDRLAPELGTGALAQLAATLMALRDRAAANPSEAPDLAVHAHQAVLAVAGEGALAPEGQHLTAWVEGVLLGLRAALTDRRDAADHELTHLRHVLRPQHVPFS